MSGHPKPLIIGHRGASHFLPENTLEAFRLAFENFRCDMIEFDVHTSQDGVPVILHDARLERTTDGRGYVSKHTLKELKALDAGYLFDPEKKRLYPERGKGIRIPTLEETFGAFPDKMFSVEIKENSAELTRKVMALVRKFGLEGRVAAGSKHYGVSQTMKKYFPGVRRFLSQREILGAIAGFKCGAGFAQDPLAVASVPRERFGFRIDSAGMIDYFHKAGIQVYFWTINDAAAMKDLRQKGVEGIITDNPAVANQVFNSKINDQNDRAKFKH